MSNKGYPKCFTVNLVSLSNRLIDIPLTERNLVTQSISMSYIFIQANSCIVTSSEKDLQSGHGYTKGLNHAQSNYLVKT